MVIINNNMEIPEFVLGILKRNNWNVEMYNLNKDTYINKIRKGYSKFDFPLTDTNVTLLSVFYNMNVKYNADSRNESLSFRLKKSLKYSQQYLYQKAEKFDVKRVIHIADINPGYFMIWLDENDGIWGDYEETIYFYGNAMNGLENLFRDKHRKVVRNIL